MTTWPATVSAPVRAAPVVLAVALNDTIPVPLPDEPDVIDSHSAFADAVQAQPLTAVTVTVPPPAPAPRLTLGGTTAKVHANASCVTVNVWPAMVSVPVRTEPVFAATANETEPFPEPDAPEVTVIQLAFDAAVHAHPFDAVTLTDPLPPPTPTFWLVGEIE